MQAKKTSHIFIQQTEYIFKVDVPVNRYKKAVNERLAHTRVGIEAESDKQYWSDKIMTL
jgi:hypothetical protein